MSKNPGTRASPGSGPVRSPSCLGGRAEAAEERSEIKTEEERDGEVRPGHTTADGGERRAARAGGRVRGKGRDREEDGKPKHVQDPEPGKRVTGGGPDTASNTEEREGTAHCAPAPRDGRDAASGLLRIEEGRGGGSRRSEVGRVRGGTGRAAARPAPRRAHRGTAEGTGRFRCGG